MTDQVMVALLKRGRGRPRNSNLLLDLQTKPRLQWSRAFWARKPAVLPVSLRYERSLPETRSDARKNSSTL